MSLPAKSPEAWHNLSVRERFYGALLERTDGRVDNTFVASPDAFSLAEGVVFHENYEVIRRIDSGAMGAVYEVLDRRTKRRRALKVMLARFADNPDVAERFRREATITADVVSEHVVETYDAGVDKPSGLPFLVMELLRGEDLGKLVARGPLPAETIATLLMQAAGALDKMHAASIIHRDLKPENLFVASRDDGSPRIKILDFGIAKVVEKAAPSATTTRNMGTPVYMSPEQVTGAGPAGPPTDLYALGHLAYTMLVGEAYWLEDALAHDTVYPLLLRIMEGVTEPASERALRTRKVRVPKTFDVWFAKATAHDPERRFRCASESIAELANALDVARPPMPSGYLDSVFTAAPTLSPPEEEPIALVPKAARVPAVNLPQTSAREHADPLSESALASHEAHRTLSPVSTLPGDAPESPNPPSAVSLEADGQAKTPFSPPKEERTLPRIRAAVVWLGAAFFLVGVIGAVAFSQSNGLGAPSRAAPIEAVVPVSTSVSPIQTAESLPVASASTTTALVLPSSEAIPQSPTASVSSSKTPPKRPLKGPRPGASSTKSSTAPSHTYGDPLRDL